MSGTGSWSDPAHWSTSSGGAAGTCDIPSFQDNVFFDVNSFTSSGGTVTIDVNAECRSMTWNGVLGNPSLSGSYNNEMSIYGSLIFDNNMNTNAFNGRWYFESTATGNVLDTKGKQMRDVYFNGDGGEWDLASDFYVPNSSIYHYYGTINANGYDMESFYYWGNYSYVKTLNLNGSGLYTARYYWQMSSSSNTTFNVGDYDILMNYGVYSNFTGGNRTYNDIEMVLNYNYYNGSPYVSYMYGNNTIDNLVVSMSSPQHLYIYNNSTFNDAQFTFTNNNSAANPEVRLYGSNQFNDFSSSSTGSYGPYFTFDQNNSFSSLTCAGVGTRLYMGANRTQTTTNALALGSGGFPVFLQSTVSGTQANLSQATGEVCLDFVWLKDMNATGGASFNAGASSSDLGNNTGWTFASCDAYYWVGGTGNWSDTTHWATSSGGSTKHLTPPSASDNVFFDGNSFSAANQTVNLDVTSPECNNMSWLSSLYNPTLDGTADSVAIHGSLIMIAAMDVDYAGAFNFMSADTGNLINSGGNTLAQVNLLGSGAWRLSNTLHVSDGIYHANGTLNTDDRDISTTDFLVGTSATKSLDLTGSEITITDGGWNVQSTSGLSFTAGTSHIILTSDSGNTDFSGNGLTYNDVTLTTPSVMNSTFGGLNTFNTLRFEAGVTATLPAGDQTTTNLEIEGACTKYVTLQSDSSGAQAGFYQTSGTVDGSFVNLTDNAASGGATFNANLSNNNGNVSGWNFTSVATLSIAVNTTLTNCQSANDGTASVVITGGTTPFTYAWSTTETTSAISGLIPGTYSVTVADSNGCDASETFTISSPPAVTLSATSTDATCYGGSDGTAQVTAGGGTAPYTYAWSSIGSGTSATGLMVGTYTVTVTDSNGCTDEAYINIASPAQVTASITAPALVCSNQGFSGSVIGSGGTAPYSYDWSFGDGNTTSGNTVNHTYTSEGTYTVTVTTTDTNGCTGQSTATIVSEFCNTPPTAVCNNITIAANTDCEASITAAQVDGGSYDYDNDPITLSVSNDGPFSIGTYDVILTVTDSVGDTSSCTATVTVVDTIAPVIACGDDITQSNDAGQCGAVVNFTMPTATDNCVEGSAQGDLATVLQNLNDNFSTVTSLVPNIYYFSDGITGNYISDGGNDMYDGGNRIGTNLASNISYSDNTIASSSAFGTGGQYFTRKLSGLWVMAADVNGLSNFNISGNNGADGGGNYDVTVLTYAAGGTTYKGFVKRVYNAYNDPSINHLIIVPNPGSAYHTYATNTDNDQHDVYGINSVTRIYHVLYASSSGGYVNNTTTQQIMEAFIDNVAGGGSPVAISQIAGLASGSQFPLGTTTNTFVATDSAGLTDTCSFDVTVEDDEVPTMNCVADFSVTAASGNCAATVTFNAPSVTDNCNPSSVTQIGGLTSGSTFPIGVSTVTYEAVDSVGNVAQCSTNITVIDPVGPTVIAQNVTVNLGSNGNATVTAAQVNNGSHGNCAGIASMSVSPSAFDCDDVGDQTVTLTVTDSNGTSSTATATVTVATDFAINPVVSNVSCTGSCDGEVDLNITGGATPYSFVTDEFSYDFSGTTVNTSLFNVTGTGYTQNGDLTVNGTAGWSQTFVTNQTFSREAGKEYQFQLNSGDGYSFMIGWYGANTASYPTSRYRDLVHAFYVSYTGVYVYEDGTYQGNVATLNYNTDYDFKIVLRSSGAYYYYKASSASTYTLAYTSSSSSESNLAVGMTPCCGNGITTDNWLVSGGGTGGSVDTTNLCPGTYDYVIQDANGCTIEYSATITEPDTLVNASIIDQDSACMDQPFTIYQTAPTGGVGGYTYTWDMGDSTIITDSVAIHTYASLGFKTILLTVTDSNGCTHSDTSLVYVQQCNVAPEAYCADATVYVDSTCTATVSANVIDSATFDADGDSLTYTLSPVGPFSVGTHTVTMVVTDPYGLSDSCTATLTVEDNALPTAIAQNLTVQLDSTGNASITASQINNGSSDACGVDAISLDVYDFDCSDVGNNTVTLTVTDVNGNSSTATATVTVEDNVVPVAIAQNLTVQLDSTGNASITANQINNGSSDACGIDIISLDVYDFDCSDVGNNTVTLTVTDVNGNSSTATATVTVEDNVVPVAIAQNLTVQLDSTGNASITANQINNGSSDACGVDAISLDVYDFDCSDVGNNTVTLTVTDVNGNSSTATATVTVEDNVVPVAIAQNLTVQLDSTGNASITANQINNGSSDACGIDIISLDVYDFDCSDVGNNTVTLTVTDVNGNSSTATATVTVEDNVVPVAIAQNLTVQLDSTGNASITASQINNGSSDACGVDAISLDVYDFDCSDVGNNTVTLTVTDVNGNSSTATATVTVEDNVVPVAIAQNLTVQLDSTGNASITANQINNGSSDACGVDAISLDVYDFDCSDVGNNTVTLTVTDVNGNSSTATATVTVEDNVVPVATAQNLTVQLDSTGNASITASQINNGSSDACGIDIISLDVYDFDCSDVGNNTVTLTVTDVNGNSSTATATVTVEDNVVPVAIAQNLTVQLDSTGNASITASQINNGSSDACGIDIISLDVYDFDCSDVGNNTVTLTVTDVNGNSSTATATVTVEDNVVPVAIAQNLTVQLDSTGNASITASQINNGSSDACGVDAISLDVYDFDCGDVGNNTVTLTVTDVNGNSSTATATVTVEDNVVPVAIAQNVDVYLDNSGNGSITATQIDNGSSDACGVDTISLDVYDFDCSDVGSNTVTLTVTDVNGNSSTSSATVNVYDSVAPQAIAQNITVALDAFGEATITPMDVDSASWDACGIDSLGLDSTMFDCSELGANTVTLTVVDVNGNVSTTTAVVNIVESYHVELLGCSSDISEDCESASAGGTYVSWDEPTARNFSSCDAGCPEQTGISGFIYLGEFGGHRYYRSYWNYNWWAANSVAQAAGGHLVSINSEDENDFLENAGFNWFVWTGGTDASSEGTFGWINGDSLGYTNWSWNQPDNNGGGWCGNNGADFVAFKGQNGRWHDRTGNAHYKFIMEVPCGNPVTITQIAGGDNGSLFSAGTDTIVYVAVDDVTGATDTCSFTVTVDTCPEISYCDASGLNSNYEWINRVRINGEFDHTSGNDNGYGDHTNVVATMNAGSNRTIKLYPGFSGCSYREYWKVYVDWNGDGDFNDYGELEYYGSGHGMKTGQISAPSWAANGEVRMRVVMRWGCYGSSCGTFNYGEVEDYIIDVTNSNGGGGNCGWGKTDGVEAEDVMSPEVTLEFSRIYPNPYQNNSDLWLELRSANEEQVQVEVVNAMGQVLYTTEVYAIEGVNRVMLDVGHLAAGVYFARPTSEALGIQFIVN